MFQGLYRNSLACFNKLPHKLLFFWIVFIIIAYIFFIQPPKLDLIVHKKDSTKMVDSFVYIAMDKLAKDTLVDYSIASLRNLGKWKGQIHVITDTPNCFSSEMIDKYNIEIVEVTPVSSIIQIKALKTQLFKILPDNINGVIYMDVDIVVRQRLDLFFDDLSDIIVNREVRLEKTKVSRKLVQDVDASEDTSEIVNIPTDDGLQHSYLDLAAFPDAMSHFVGFCANCDKWHTGILYLRRDLGKECLKSWNGILLSGTFDTDQASLDEAERLGDCPNIARFPTRHLLFAKDYLGGILASGQTFIHMTSVANAEAQDYFYKSIVVPRLRSSLEPALRQSILQHEKVCE